MRPSGARDPVQHVPIPPERAGLELDEFLCLVFPRLSKGAVRRKVRDGQVLLDGRPTTPGHKLREHEVLLVEVDELEEGSPEPEQRGPELDVLWEDEHVLAVDKPAGLAAEPERWARENASLSGAVLDLALSRGAGPPGADEEHPGEDALSLGFRPRLVHRLDKDTTGVVLVAKTLEAERELRAAFEDGRVRKRYLALVEGELRLPDGEEQVIDLPIGPDERRSGRMRVDLQRGKPSRTRVRVEQRFQGYTLLSCEPETGRTHQIRVHLRETGFPLAVDPYYGRRDSLSLSDFKRDYRRKPGHVEAALIDRLTLHAREIEFPRVAGQGRVRVEAPIPKDLARTLKQLAKFRAP
ncbi:MAG: RluA family pseudouridine synthase [Planctomycetes bacterium]|nr:RluA family pseudouridine synthase [Planctomycetota bacterium]